MRPYLNYLGALSQRRFLAALLLFATVLRIVAVLMLRNPGLGPHPSAGNDGTEFDMLAWQLAAGHGFSWADGTLTAARAIGFPYVLSLVYRLFGHSYLAAYLLFVTIGVAAVAAIYGASRALLGELGGRIAAVVAALHPILIYLTTEFLSEELFILLTALALWVGLGMRSRRITGPLLCGLVMSAAMLVRPQALFLVPGFVALYGVRDRRLLAPVLFTAALVVGQLPWVVRNRQVLGGFVLVASNGGHTLNGANNDVVLHDRQFRGSWVPIGHSTADTLVEPVLGELAKDRAERNQGMQWIRAHPLRYGKLVAWKLWNLAMPWDTSSASRQFKLATGLAGLPIMVLLFSGVGIAVRRRMLGGPWIVMHLALAGVLLMTVVFYGSPRLRDSFAPFLLPYAALAVLTWARLPVDAWSEVTTATRAVDTGTTIEPSTGGATGKPR